MMHRVDREMLYSLKIRETFTYQNFKLMFEHEGLETDLNPYDIWIAYIGKYI